MVLPLNNSAGAAQKPLSPSSPAKAPAPQAPSVSGFRISAKRKVGAEELAKKLSELSFVEVSQERNALLAMNVESRDIQKNPYQFSIIYFFPDSIEARYTILPNTSPKKRRIEVLQHFLNMLTIVENAYSFQMQDIFQLLESSIADMTEYSSLEYERLFGLYDSQKAEIAALQKKVKQLLEANTSLSKENFELKTKNDELSVKLRSLETLSDSVLTLKIQEWLLEHKGEINIADFSKVYNVPENRVEQMLNKLVIEGYIETKG